jgi:hypothetical protein
MLYWLFTFNYLIPFKGYFDTEEDAQEKLLDILRKSVAYHKNVLMREANQEILQNTVHENDIEYKESDRLQKKYEEWSKFTKDDLVSSIILRKIEGWKREDLEEVLTLNYNRPLTTK